MGWTPKYESNRVDCGLERADAEKYSNNKGCLDLRYFGIFFFVNFISVMKKDTWNLGIVSQ